MKKYVKQVVTAKRNYCVPAVLQMVLEHHGIFGLTQDIIANQLDIVPDNEKVDHIYWGTQIANNTLNNFFEHNGINLYEQYMNINTFMDDYFFQETIVDMLKKEISIICGYNYTWLYGNREDTYRHVSIIVDFDSKTEKVTLLDPGPKDAGYKEVTVDKLFIAIKAAKDGLWCIMKK